MPEKALAPHVFCFTTSAHGGVSEGEYQSFNLGAHVGDNPTHVNINRELLMVHINRQICLGGHAIPLIKPIHWLNQQHSNAVIEYANASPELVSDAIFTDSYNTPLAVMTADCLPIVIFCQSTERLSVVHAGYKGLMNNIIANALSHFSDKNALSVWIGPSIKQGNFQISADLLDIFKGFESFIKKDTMVGKYLVDLPAIACQMLQTAGVKHIQVSNVCTYENTACFSHRRSVHQQQKACGRMATVAIKIALQ